MYYKRIIAIIICVTMLIAAVAGCSSDTDGPEIPSDPVAPAAPTAQTATVREHSHNDHGIDYEAAFAAFAPDTVMVNIGDLTVTWAELFFYLRANINNVFSYFGVFPDWEDEVLVDTTFADFIMHNAVADITESKVVEHGARQLGVTISEEDVQNISDHFNALAERNGGEEAFLKMIWEEDGCYDRELFYSLVKTNHFVNSAFMELYGENGELVSDDELAQHVSFDGYIMAKHILKMHTDDNPPLARYSIEEIWKLLDEYNGSDFGGFFDELMFAFSEDPGRASNPEGYLFQIGDMVDEFYDAAVALEIGQFSEIVESDFGYHIIYRIPINFDSVPSSGYMMNDQRSLREIVMMDMFNVMLMIWRNGLTIDNTDTLESMNLAEIFKPCDC